jgi:osmotically-inducible protein OsmY
MTTSTGIKIPTARLGATFALLALTAFSFGARAAERDNVTDRAIAQNVERSIDERADLRAPNRIHVQARDHVVYLSGFVSAGIMRSHAAAVAMAVPGVTRVVNEIAISY